MADKNEAAKETSLDEAGVHSGGYEVIRYICAWARVRKYSRFTRPNAACGPVVNVRSHQMPQRNATHCIQFELEVW